MLRSLMVKNFRSLTDFSIPKLGNVNLIVGKNNAGKSTVLEAIRVYAGDANRYLLDDIAETHDEAMRSRDLSSSPSNTTLPYESFFSGREFPQTDGEKIVICDGISADQQLTIEHVFAEVIQESISNEAGESEQISRRKIIPKRDLSALTDEAVRQAILVSKGDRSVLTFLDSNRLRTTIRDLDAQAQCSIVPTTFISMNELARDWDKIALTEHENVVKRALQQIAPELEGLTFIEGPNQPVGGRRELARTARVKMAGLSRPVPLSSLGDGILRVFQMTLRAFSARNGYLLIDEFENGLHYTIQDRIWDTVFDLSHSQSTQIFATTHSWDCIQSFARIAKIKTGTTGMLIRVGQSVMSSNRGQVISTVFDEEKLWTVTQDHLEVR